MLVAVIADTHSRQLPDECVRRLRAADVILHAGDHSTAASLNELSALGPPVHAVLGNVDEPALHGSLPSELVLAIEGVRVGMVHEPGAAVGREARLAAHFPGCSAIVYGHTHRPHLERHGDIWILNPGSPTERRCAPERTMLEVRVAGSRVTPRLISLGRRERT